MSPTVSAALIVRNEERFLPGCLDTLAGNLDEVVVVDTGSTDSTVDIARASGARVLHFAWCDDFAAARNYGLAAASGDWILYIDADERLTVPGDGLQQSLDEKDVVAARLLFYPRLESTPYRELRLFRNLPALRFSGAMHETIVPAVDALTARSGMRVTECGAIIRHLGYEGDLARKHARNLPLLRAAVESDPQRLYCWHHLAETLAAMGRPQEALEACQAGLSIAAGKPGNAGAGVIAALLWLTCAKLLREAEGDGMAAIDSGLAAYPGHRALLFLKARVLVDRGEHGQALEILDRLRFADSPSYVDPLVSYDCRIFGAFAHDLAGIALLRLGRRDAAAAAFGLAAEAEPGDPSYRVKAAALAAGPLSGQARPRPVATET
jgi:glycosyltransferase involved in cell wall biosynthesis